MAFVTAAISAGEVICWVPESFASPLDCQFYEGRDLLNDVPVSGGPDLAPGNTS